jgi:hypothetical protein
MSQITYAPANYIRGVMDFDSSLLQQISFVPNILELLAVFAIRRCV